MSLSRFGVFAATVASVVSNRVVEAVEASPATLSKIMNYTLEVAKKPANSTDSRTVSPGQIGILVGAALLIGVAVSCCLCASTRRRKAGYDNLSP